MRFPRLADAIYHQLLRRVALRRPPDFIIGADNIQDAYLLRWFLTPWRNLQSDARRVAESDPTWFNRAVASTLNLLPNLYLHRFMRDDDDRALHDHPSFAVSLLLHNGYIEHTIAAGGIHHQRHLDAGDLRFLPTRHTHRVALPRPHGVPVECWTLFLFGPTVREWGFHCPERGWVHWKEFTAAGKPGEIGPGCGA